MRLTRGVNDRIVPSLGRKVLEQGVKEDAEGGDVQEEAKGGTPLRDRIVQRTDETFITGFGVPNETGGSADNVFGSLVTLPLQTSPQSPGRFTPLPSSITDLVPHLSSMAVSETRFSTTVSENIGPSRFAWEKMMRRWSFCMPIGMGWNVPPLPVVFARVLVSWCLGCSLTGLAIPITEHPPPNDDDTRTRDELRLRMFNVMLSQWCGNSYSNSSPRSPPDPETMQPVLQGLYTLQREIVQRHHPTTPLPDTTNAGSTTLPLYKDNLLARTFWYEVRPPPPPPPEPIPPDYLLTLRAT